jgi:ABC-type amino acid transport substrate-binding protein
MKKILGSAAFLIVLGVFWLFAYQGAGRNILNAVSQNRSESSELAQPGQGTANSGSSNNAPAAGPSTTASAAFVPARDTLKSILNNGVVRVSVENPSRPFYSDAGGKPEGFNVDFARLLFAQREFTSQNHPTVVVDTQHGVDTYPAVPAQLTQTGNDGNPTVDIAMDGLTFADDTPAGVVYTVPYVDDFGYSLVVTRNSPIRSAADMAGKTVGILQGDPDVKAFVTRAFPNSRIVELSDASINGERSWMAHFLNGGQVDGIVYDYPFGVSEIQGTTLTFAVTKLEGSNLAYKIGVRKDDTALLAYLNSAIAKVRQSPEYLDLLRKYFISDQIVTTAATAREKTYVVRAGDTLAQIAVSQLGSGARFRDIQKRNNLPNPNLIIAGEHLTIPER